MLNGQADDCSLDDRQRAVVLQPRGPLGQPGAQPVPCLSGGLAAEAGAGDRNGLLSTPGGRGAEAELSAMLGRPSALRVGQEELLPGGRRAAHHPVRPGPAEDLDGQAGQQNG
ncbi:hypothetical protein Sfulv_61220 [Streptomyces fulvorobeus]|uniref:Uncharacterized protein n=1 Tax=Streptomyces fulvorobeus TaxID=284028 RepID=A0A7J0CFQ2_9ACTN|nr:hypothetical protein Sfulv_61220 [Streptomyces fulvorobeus]